ncbi:probable WRKY transcription factor 49 [Ananas comosus]|uniref:WRKY domain-containing protein n=2 Tax=Ananas comosus TaxID=4615 RepID=A0A6V7PCU5_ANACO|nr:probable WRKY transcription factor 49 [Ananas comosus]CAD1828677.1 unnamed protein product [Ananas comosus var. bracteatus]
MMDELDEMEQNWHDGLGEELMRELLDNTTPLFFSPQVAEAEEDSHRESVVNKLISTVYSGPTIGDIESALSLTSQSSDTENQNNSRPIVSLTEKGLSKMENKYTLRIKTCGNGLSDDGYKWRKYGQKAIKNSPNPRSYYRCTNPRCNAKKQVERSTEDPETLVVTYEGLHLHYTYSHFLLSRSPEFNSAGLSTAKKPKINPMGHKNQIPDYAPHEPAPHSSAIVSSEQSQGEDRFGDLQYGLLDEDEKSARGLGLLEDVVPLLVRKPCNSTTTSSCDPYSPQASSPSISSLSWTPNSPCIDMSILSNIM